MFKCMESQSAHVIEIIKNGHTATERPEPTVSSSATNQAELSGLDSLRQFGLVLGVCQCTCAQCSVTGFRFIPPDYSFWKSLEAAMYFGAVLHYDAFLASGDKAWARFCCRTLLASPKSMASRDCLEPVSKESTTLNSCHSSLAIRTKECSQRFQLAQPGHSTLLCYAHLWSSAKHGLSCMILRVVKHLPKRVVTQFLPVLKQSLK